MQIEGIISLDTHPRRQRSVQRIVQDIAATLLIDGAKPGEANDHTLYNKLTFLSHQEDINSFLENKKNVAIIINKYFAEIPEVRDWIQSRIDINKKILLSCQRREDDDPIQIRSEQNEVHHIQSHDTCD